MHIANTNNPLLRPGARVLGALYVLGRRDLPPTASNVAARACVEPAQLERVLTRLERLGLVTRDPLALTLRGLAVAASLAADRARRASGRAA